MGRQITMAVVGVLLAALVLTNVAGATVTFNPATGTGFVGKGDVQAAFAAYGWNDAVLQQNAPLITFTWVAEWSYTVVCTGTAGSQTYIQVGGGFGHVVTDPRTNPNGKVTGFNLLGWQPGTLIPGEPDADAPVVGDACGGGTIAPGTVTSVTYNNDRVDLLFVNVPNFSSQVVWHVP